MFNGNCQDVRTAYINRWRWPFLGTRSKWRITFHQQLEPGVALLGGRQHLGEKLFDDGWNLVTDILGDRCNPEAECFADLGWEWLFLVTGRTWGNGDEWDPKLHYLMMGGSWECSFSVIGGSQKQWFRQRMGPVVLPIPAATFFFLFLQKSLLQPGARSWAYQ